MKIIEITLGRANPNRMNGVNNVVHNLSNALAKNSDEIDIEVWGLTDSKGSDDIERDFTLKVFNTFNVIPSFNQLHAIYKLRNSDVLFHFHGVYIFQFFMLSLILFFFRMPWCVTPHGGYSKNNLVRNEFFKKIYIKTIDSFYIKRSLFVHLLAKNELEDFERVFHGVDTVIIPNGVNCEKFIPSNSVSDIPNYFVFCGRLTEQKGLDRLVRGFKNYVSAGGNLDLCIIGEGDKEAFLKDFINDNNLNDRIKLVGAKFDSEKNSIISRSSAFLLTSYFEGFPIALLEAMSLNKPLVVTKETNIGDLVRDNDLGVFIENYSDDELCNALFFMENNYESFKCRPYEFVKNNYTWKQIALNMSALYREYKS